MTVKEYFGFGPLEKILEAFNRMSEINRKKGSEICHKPEYLQNMREFTENVFYWDVNTLTEKQISWMCYISVDLINFDESVFDNPEKSRPIPISDEELVKILQEHGVL